MQNNKVLRGDGPISNRLQRIRQAGGAVRNAYYGWYVVAACNGVAFITWGVAIFNQGIFLGHYVTAFGWSPAVLSVGPVLFNLWAGIAGVWVGRIIDRRGPRIVLLAGAALIALAMIGLGLAREIWQVYAAFLLLGSGFACIHTITLGKIVTRWFIRHRARAMAAATIGAGAGGAILVPLNAAIIERFGALAGGAAMAAVTIAVIVPLALFVVKDGPEALGLEPDGADGPAGEAPDRAADSHAWTLGAAMRTAAFWGLSVCFGLVMMAQVAYLVHQVIFLQASLGLFGAASIVTVTTIMGMVGRAGFVLIGNRLPVRWWAAAMFATQAASFLMLGLGATPFWLTLGSALFGLTMGIVVILQPLATAAVFGQASFGRVYGAVYMSIRIGAAIGPLIAGLLVVAAGGYQAVWLLMVGAPLAGMICIPWALSAPKARG